MEIAFISGTIINVIKINNGLKKQTGVTVL